MIKSIFKALGWGQVITPRQAEFLPEGSKFEVNGEILTSVNNAKFAVDREINRLETIEILKGVMN